MRIGKPTFPRYILPFVPLCLCAFVPLCLCAFVPCAFVPLCLCAFVPKKSRQALLVRFNHFPSTLLTLELEGPALK